MAGVLGGAIDAAMAGRDRGNQLFTQIERMKAMQQEQAQREQDRLREQESQKFSYYDKQLNDPDQYMQFDDDTLTKLKGARIASARALGLEVPEDVNPMFGAIQKSVYELQTDPYWLDKDPETRMNFLRTKYGKHLNQTLANFTNIEKINGYSTQSEVNTNGKVQTIKDDKKSDTEVMTAKQPARDEEAYQLFGGFYKPKPPPAESIKYINDKLNAYAQAAIDPNANPEHVAALEADLFNEAKRTGVSLTRFAATEAVRVAKQITAKQTFDGLMEQLIADQSTQRWNSDKNSNLEDRKVLTDLANSNNLLPSKVTPDYFLKFGQGKREEQFYERKKEDLGIQETRASIANMQRDNARADAQFNLDASNTATDNARADRQLDLSASNIAADNARADTTAASGGGKSSGKGKDFGLSKGEQAAAGRNGFSSNAMKYGYQRIRKFFGTYQDPKSPYWKSTTNEDGKIISRNLTKAGKARINEINSTEKKAREVRYKTVGRGSNAPIHYGTHAESGTFDITEAEAKRQGKTLESIAKELQSQGYIAAVRKKGQSGITSNHIHAADPEKSPNEAARLTKQSKSNKSVYLPESKPIAMDNEAKSFIRQWKKDHPSGSFETMLGVLPKEYRKLDVDEVKSIFGGKG